jgi:hypothetical protein
MSHGCTCWLCSSPSPNWRRTAGLTPRALNFDDFSKSADDDPFDKLLIFQTSGVRVIMTMAKNVTRLAK